MKLITILSEPRSGSFNLFKWLKIATPERVRALFEPFSGSWDDAIDVPYGDTSWIEDIKNSGEVDLLILCVKVRVEGRKANLKNLFKLSDKVIFLYRENVHDQFESYIRATSQNQWLMPSVPVQANKLSALRTDLKIKDDFKWMKDVNNSLATLFDADRISYEELYEQGKIEKLKNMLRIETETEFPIGYKYQTRVL